jgi:glycerate 2-kinase
MKKSQREILKAIFDAAVSAAHPDNCLPPHLPAPPSGRIIILAAGKAAGSMAAVAEHHYLDHLGLAPDRLTGIAVARQGYAQPTRIVRMIEAAHPVPDARGLAAASEALALARSAGPNDLVLTLVSGGGSAVWIAPSPGITLDMKQALTRQLLRCGATISEINTVRKHLSAIKGGRLAAAAHPASVLTLAISDVPDDDPATIASGPTVSDRTTLADARAVLAKYDIEPAPAVAAALDDPTSESPKPGDPRLAEAEFRLVATPASALEAAERTAAALGFRPHPLGADLEGEACDMAAAHAQLALVHADSGNRTAILSGGEATVTIRGSGRGGPNQEFALALALALDGRPGIWALAGDTDGTDGGIGSADDPAGAYVTPDTLLRANRLGLDPHACLDDNDSTGFFMALGDLLAPGPTLTNVNDLRAVIVDMDDH